LIGWEACFYMAVWKFFVSQHALEKMCDISFYNQFKNPQDKKGFLSLNRDERNYFELRSKGLATDWVDFIYKLNYKENG
jgi:hypothetical protein